MDDPYELDQLVTKYLGKEYITILIELTKEYDHLEQSYKAKVKHGITTEYTVTKYMKYAHDFLFYLNTGGIPSGIGLLGLTHFKPIIEDLVAKRNLKEEALDIFT